MQNGERVRRSRGLWTSGLMFACAVSMAGPVLAQKAEGDKPVFLITDVVIGADVAIDREAARDALANRFGRLRGKIEVRSLAEVKTTLDRAAMAQLLGSSASDEDISRIGEYVAVDRLVFGRIHQVAGVTELQVKIFNTKEGVTEVGLSRRLKEGAPPQLVLTLLDTLADGLLAFVLDTYSDGAPSQEFAALKNKKLAPPPAKAAPLGRLSMLAVVGGVVAGAGAGVATVGGIGLLDAGEQAADLPVVLAVAGAGAVIVGTALIILDGVSE